MSYEKIDPQQISDMIRHWLQTPLEGYLGSDYGQDIKSLLHLDINGGDVAPFIAKMIRDIPVLSVMPKDSINIYTQHDGVDKVSLIIEFMGTVVDIIGMV